jgi:hypothetical protein
VAGLLFGLAAAPTSAASTFAPQAIQADAPAPVPAPLSAEALEAYRARSDFQYERGGPGPSLSLWDRIMRWISENILQPIFSPEFSPVRRFVFWVIAAAVLIWVVLRILRMERGSVFSKRAAKRAGLLPTEEELRRMDFPALIAEAEAQRDLRRALRFRYLAMLRALVEADRLAYAPDATNRAYAAQLYETAYYEPFLRATDRFEEAYYGDAPVEQSDYADFVAQTERLNAALSDAQGEAAPGKTAPKKPVEAA